MSVNDLEEQNHIFLHKTLVVSFLTVNNWCIEHYRRSTICLVMKKKSSPNIKWLIRSLSDLE